MIIKIEKSKIDQGLTWVQLQLCTLVLQTLAVHTVPNTHRQSGSSSKCKVAGLNPWLLQLPEVSLSKMLIPKLLLMSS